MRRSGFDAGMLLFGLMAGIFVLSIFYAWFWKSNLWPSNQALLQGRYIRDCAAARAIGVTPLYSGHPGYRESLDADNDGIACEPFW
jgi:hypothetical protein